MIPSSSPVYKFADALLIIIACWVSYKLRFGTFLMPQNYFIISISHVFFTHLALQSTSFYRDSNSQLSPNAIVSCAAAFIVSLFIISTLLYITKTGEDFSRQWIVVTNAIAAAFIITFRAFISRVQHSRPREKNIAIIGRVSSLDTEKKAKLFCAANGLKLALYDANPDDQLQSIVDEIERLRRLSDKSVAISEVWLASSVFNRLSTLEIEAIFSDTAVRIVYLPDLPHGLITTTNSLALQNGVLTVDSSISKSNKLNHVLKFLEDKLISITALILLFPVFALISLAIKLDSRGPIFFKQNRYGVDGKEFKVWKFRTMTNLEGDSEFRQATSDDTRVTRVGKLLRRSSLDELPQLINVLLGTMSIVGPRPHPIKLNEQFRGVLDGYMKRHTMKPGITGLAQINGFRGELQSDEDMKMRVRNDLEYIRNWSVLLDFKIIFLTFTHLITTDKAY
ncbi:exopolysaccharide biosynthesis polyprenyl glycosylphosphotransferase [Arenicella sp. 4NH20-0111]|uniref:exopolysaccharide biosynthesis polyprenyl glycosylphosphotransferase n=1 Tax=Arenicella sp. 4NH20-0111 TaxID=3127648 RepID=UPI0033401358